MSTVQAVCNALVDIVNTDAQMQTIMGRSAQLIVPVGADVLDAPTPMLTYKVLRVSRSQLSDRQMDVQISACAKLSSDAEAMIDRMEYWLDTDGVTLAAFRARGLDVISNPSSVPAREYPDMQQEAGEPSEIRVDLLCSLIIPD